MFTCFNVSCFVHDMSNVCPFTHAQKKKMHTHSNFAVIVVLVTLPAGGSQYNFSINRLAEDFFLYRFEGGPQITSGSPVYKGVCRCFICFSGFSQEISHFICPPHFLSSLPFSDFLAASTGKTTGIQPFCHFLSFCP